MRVELGGEVRPNSITPSTWVRPQQAGFRITKEVAISRGSTTAKRDRERALQKQRQEKEAKRALRKAEKGSRPSRSEGEDPDLAGLRWGPQPPLF